MGARHWRVLLGLCGMLLVLQAVLWRPAVPLGADAAPPPDHPRAPAPRPDPDRGTPEARPRVITGQLAPQGPRVPEGTPECSQPQLTHEPVCGPLPALDPARPLVDVVVTACTPPEWLPLFVVEALPPGHSHRVFWYRTCPNVSAPGPLPAAALAGLNLVQCRAPALWSELVGYFAYLRTADRTAGAAVFLQPCPYRHTCLLHRTVRGFLSAPTPHGYLALGNRLLWPKCQPQFQPFLPLTCDTKVPGGDRVQAWDASQFVVTRRVLDRTPSLHWSRVQCLFETAFSASPEKQSLGVAAMEFQWHMMFGFPQAGSFLGPNQTHSAPLWRFERLPLPPSAAPALACLFSIDRGTPEGSVSIRALSFPEFKQLAPSLRRLNGSRVQKWLMYGNNRFVKPARADVLLSSVFTGLTVEEFLQCAECLPHRASPRGLPVAHCPAPHPDNR